MFSKNGQQRYILFSDSQSVGLFFAETVFASAIFSWLSYLGYLSYHPLFVFLNINLQSNACTDAMPLFSKEANQKMKSSLAVPIFLVPYFFIDEVK